MAVMASRRSALTPSLIVIVGFLTVCPVVMLVFGSFSEGLGAFGSFTLEKYIQSYSDPELADIIVNTVIFTVGSALVATLWPISTRAPTFHSNSCSGSFPSFR